jgi:hypothetical protein
MFNGSDVGYALGNSGSTTGYSYFGISSLVRTATGQFTLNLANPPGSSSRPVAFAQAVNAASGAGNVSTYTYRAVAFNNSGDPTNLIKVNITNQTGSGYIPADSVQFMIIW